MQSFTVSGALTLLALAGLANALILGGFAFVNAQFLTGALGGIYAASTNGIRLAVMTVTLIPAANYLLALSYRQYPSWAAGMAQIGTLMLAIVTRSILDAGGMPARGWMAAAAAIAASAWFGYESSRI